VGGSYDEEKLRWEIESLREAIAGDWVALASRRTLDPDNRKAIRDHLDMSICALRAATAQLNAHLRAERGSVGVTIDLERSADQSHLTPPLPPPAADTP
jgi:hypothetical protein